MSTYIDLLHLFACKLSSYMNKTNKSNQGVEYYSRKLAFCIIQCVDVVRDSSEKHVMIAKITDSFKEMLVHEINCDVSKHIKKMIYTRTSELLDEVVERPENTLISETMKSIRKKELQIIFQNSFNIVLF